MRISDRTRPEAPMQLEEGSMKRSVIGRVAFVLAVFGLLAGSFFAGRLLAGSGAATAHAEVTSVSPASPEVSFYCNVDNVAAFDNRIHVRCSSSPGGGVKYFAHPTGSTSGYTASRMLAVAQTAYALGRPVWVYYVSSSSSNPPGCNTGDCRLLTGVSMVNP
jgi:hypothetical protein